MLLHVNLIKLPVFRDMVSANKKLKSSNSNTPVIIDVENCLSITQQTN